MPLQESQLPTPPNQGQPRGPGIGPQPGAPPTGEVGLINPDTGLPGVPLPPPPPPPPDGGAPPQPPSGSAPTGSPSPPPAVAVAPTIAPTPTTAFPGSFATPGTPAAAPFQANTGAAAPAPPTFGPGTPFASQGGVGGIGQGMSDDDLLALIVQATGA